MVSRTPGSCASGSRSSKLAIRLSLGQTTCSPLSRTGDTTSSASSAGSRQASANQGQTP